jgi:hypothetical protein
MPEALPPRSPAEPKLDAPPAEAPEEVLLPEEEPAPKEDASLAELEPEAEAGSDMQGAAQVVSDYLSDDAINQLTQAVATIAESIPQDKAESLIDDFGKFMAAAMNFKATVSASVLTLIPSRIIKKRIQDIITPIIQKAPAGQPSQAMRAAARRLIGRT